MGFLGGLLTEGLSFDHLSLGAAAGYSTVIGGAYVGVLYLVTPKHAAVDRDSSAMIKRRGLAVTVVSMLSPVVLWVAAESKAGAPTLLEHLGIRVGMSGLAQLMAVALPLALNATLFAGPLLQQLYDDGLPGLSDLGTFLTDWTNIRATIIAPITEEIAFRSCMVPLLAPALGRGPALYWGAPCFFGIAHLHHIIEGRPPMVVGLQFGYTTVFGAITTFIFSRTSSISGPIACHAFSNYMGFPDFGGALAHRKSLSLKIMYVAGLVGFFALLKPITEPSLFL